MKSFSKILLIVIISFLSTNLSAQNQFKSELKNAKVFLAGAELTHIANIKLEKGMNEIFVSGLADGINPKSISAKLLGKGVIVTVKQVSDYLSVPFKDNEVIKLEDSIKSVASAINTKKIEHEAIGSELEILAANKNISDKGFSINEIQKLTDYYKRRLIDTRTSMLKIEKDIEKLNKDLSRLNKQLNEYMVNNKTNVLVIVINSDAKADAKLDLNYFTYNASWTPFYNFRVENLTSPLKLEYSANIKQTTGLLWKGIDVTLSTRNPNQSNTKPELYPWYVDFYRPMSLQYGSGMLKRNQADMQEISVAAAPQAEKSMADYMNVTETQLSVEFKPEMQMAIPSDGKNYLVELSKDSFDAEYKYAAIPKYDSDAFLTAQINNFKGTNFLPGSVNIYFENSFAGETYLNPQQLKDTLVVSLGRDKGINSSRELKKDLKENKFLSSDIDRTLEYEVKVKNSKSIAVDLVIEDQVPVTRTEDINVKILEISGAELNKETGILKWRVKLNPGETITKKLSYILTYPKDKQVNGI
ncbi:MAG: DUF4139 domain-containing protein [Melioribacteraceae bacterium]|nr:DUF4139 domain-containing protein [Melioribacteraceae bacterium]